MTWPTNSAAAATRLQAQADLLDRARVALSYALGQSLGAALKPKFIEGKPSANDQAALDVLSDLEKATR